MDNVNDDRFEEEIENSDTPVLVDFYTEWCQPCKALMPIIEKLSEEFDGVKFVKVNVESAPIAAIRHKISSVPTVMLFNNGEACGKFLGLRKHDDYKEALNDLIARS